MNKRTYITYEVDDVKKMMKEVLKEAKIPSTDTLAQFKDDLIKEIKDLRDDVTLVTGYKDQIEDHDYRIEKNREAFESSANIIIFSSPTPTKKSSGYAGFLKKFSLNLPTVNIRSAPLSWSNTYL